MIFCMLLILAMSAISLPINYKYYKLHEGDGTVYALNVIILFLAFLSVFFFILDKMEATL